jgi:glycerol-3-phosphate cytidylyltransferase-like family protein
VTQALRNPGSIFYDANELAEHINIRRQAEPCMTFLCIGEFDPIHNGHMRFLRDMSDRAHADIFPGVGGITIAAVAGDQFVMKKFGLQILQQGERAEVLAGCRYIDYVVIWNDMSQNFCGLMERIRPDFFCTGRSSQDLNDSLEMKICKTMGTKTLFNVGGQRIHSREKIFNRISNEQNAPYFRF